jgi:enoyl-CoA hydratase/carnithine racemase
VVLDEGQRRGVNRLITSVAEVPIGRLVVAAQLGWGNAMRFLLTGEEFGAAEALRIGLVQEVVPAGEHVQRAFAIAALIAKQSPLGEHTTHENARVARTSGPAAAVEHNAAQLTAILSSQDAMEGVQSFIERREARFTGA